MYDSFLLHLLIVPYLYLYLSFQSTHLGPGRWGVVGGSRHELTSHDRPLTTFSVRKDSHTISKPKPEIRIVHIFAPEIIKTDVDNFRELVQQLTGKPRGRIIKKTVNRSPTEMSGLQRNNLHGREKADIEGEAREEDGRRPWPDGSPSGGGISVDWKMIMIMDSSKGLLSSPGSSLWVPLEWMCDPMLLHICSSN
uniref:VQ domain-containing protein n=1 Tax=Ananas comosus var. bracteatus TaxID=296719 RepID=A0A6V7Q8H1_ANACO|nr:unnamed protein product [Ananas comosus var. bracteatus]